MIFIGTRRDSLWRYVKTFKLLQTILDFNEKRKNKELSIGGESFHEFRSRLESTEHGFPKITCGILHVQKFHFVPSHEVESVGLIFTVHSIESNIKFYYESRALRRIFNFLTTNKLFIPFSLLLVPTLSISFSHCKVTLCNGIRIVVWMFSNCSYLFPR